MGARRNLCQTNRLKGALEPLQGIATLTNRLSNKAAIELFTATPGREHPHPKLHQTDIALSGSHRGGTVHRQLSATTKGVGKGRRDHRLRATPQIEEGTLHQSDQLIDIVPSPHLHRSTKIIEIHPRREARTLVADHHTDPGLLLQLLDCGEQQLNHRSTQGVGLRVNFEAEHPITEIDQTSRRITLDKVTSLLQFRQIDRPRVTLNQLIVVTRNIIGRTITIEACSLTAGKQAIDPGRQWEAVGAHQFGTFSHPEGIPDLERTELMGKTPADRTIHISHTISDLGQASGGVGYHRQRSQSNNRCTPIIRLLGGTTQHKAQALAKILTLLGLPDKIINCCTTMGRQILHTLQIEGVKLTFPTHLHLFVEALTRLLPQLPCGHHPREEIVIGVDLATLIVRNDLIDILGHIVHHIDTHLIE